MNNQEYNNDFFSYQGRISRRNYIINMFILLGIFFGVNFIKLETFEQFITYKFIYSTLVFVISMTKFVSIMAILSVVYRRIADFTQNKDETYKEVMRKLFILLFVLPVLYDFCIRFFVNVMPLLQRTLDLTVVFILYPLAIITSIILCFVKGRNIES